MKYRYDYAWGKGKGVAEYKVQISIPQIKFKMRSGVMKKSQLFIGMDTTIHIYEEAEKNYSYKAFGFAILGFGIAICKTIDNKEQ